MRRLLLVVAAALAATAAVAAAKDSYRTHTVPNDGITLALPSSWKAIDFRQALKPGVVADLAKKNPELAGSLQAMTKPNSPVKFFAFDPKSVQGFATNSNVVLTKVPPGVPFATYVQALRSEISGLKSVSGLTLTEVQLPAGRAAKLHYNLKANVGSRVLTSSTYQYAFLRGTTSTVFTYTTLPPLDSKYGPIFTTSARSIHFG